MANIICRIIFLDREGGRMLSRGTGESRGTGKKSESRGTGKKFLSRGTGKKS